MFKIFSTNFTLELVESAQIGKWTNLHSIDDIVHPYLKGPYNWQKIKQLIFNLPFLNSSAANPFKSQSSSRNDERNLIKKLLK
jgi:hypothetical protein